MSTFTQKLKNKFQSTPVQPPKGDLISLKRTEIISPAGSSEIGGLFVIQAQDLISVRRLVVLIPNLDIDEAEVAREIWKLAFPPGLAVLFLGLCPSVNEEPRVRRRLATIAALTRDQRISVEVQLEFGRNWTKKMKTVLDVGDIVICPAGQQIGIFREPLELSLAKLGHPIITLPALYPLTRKLIPDFIRGSIFWVVSLAVLFAFFWFQSRMLRISDEWAKDTLLSLSVLIEFGLIWVWNDLSQ